LIGVWISHLAMDNAIDQIFNSFYMNFKLPMIEKRFNISETDRLILIETIKHQSYLMNQIALNKPNAVNELVDYIIEINKTHVHSINGFHVLKSNK